MTSPVSLPVVGAAALISSPALYDALVVGSLPLTAALIRFVVAATVVWLGLSLVGGLVAATSAAPSDAPKALPVGSGTPPAGPDTAELPAQQA